MKEMLQGNMTGKICLVTGATNGIGKATAQALAQMGATVVIVGRNPAKRAAVVHQCTDQRPTQWQASLELCAVVQVGHLV